MTIAEQIECQERANAVACGMTIEEYRAWQDRNADWYITNKRQIDTQIAADDAELDTGDGEGVVRND